MVFLHPPGIAWIGLKCFFVFSFSLYIYSPKKNWNNDNFIHYQFNRHFVMPQGEVYTVYVLYSVYPHYRQDFFLQDTTLKHCRIIVWWCRIRTRASAGDFYCATTFSKTVVAYPGKTVKLIKTQTKYCWKLRVSA